MSLKTIMRVLLFSIFAVCLIFSNTHSKDFILNKVDLPQIGSDKIILTIKTNSKNIGYTYAKIESLGLKRLKTSTYWEEDDGVYEGVLLRDLLKDAGIENSETITVTALDGYSADIPKIDWEQWPVLLATRKDGKIMTIRKKGPTRIIYPKDIGGEIAETDMRIRWVWAIKIIEVKN